MVGGYTQDVSHVPIRITDLSRPTVTASEVVDKDTLITFTLDRYRVSGEGPVAPTGLTFHHPDGEDVAVRVPTAIAFRVSPPQPPPGPIPTVHVHRSLSRVLSGRSAIRVVVADPASSA